MACSSSTSRLTLSAARPQFARNIISGNSSNGVHIFGASGVNNTVLGNSIGLDVTGTRTIGNQGNGVLIDNAGPTSSPSAQNLVSGNVISGNAQSGVAIVSSQEQGGNAVSGNEIGTSASEPKPSPTGLTACSSTGRRPTPSAV